MDIWSKARSIAQEAAKRSQDLTITGSKIADIVSETAKRSMELAAEASKAADQIKIEALKRADQIKSLPIIDPSYSASISSALSTSVRSQGGAVSEEELERFGVTDELREFVKYITLDTFRDFPLSDDALISDVPTISNVQQDLSKWQERHATLVLSTVKEISKLRYELCPRIMKERKFWRIYFMLVNCHVTPYEKRYMEELALKSEEQKKDDRLKGTLEGAAPSEPHGTATGPQIKKASSAEQDLDVFLLGDLGDSDEEGPVVGDDGLDDDLDKIDDSSDDEKAKGSKAQS